MYLCFMKYKILYSLFVLLLLPFLSSAHGYWMDIQGSGKINQPVHIQICYGEIDEYGVRHREKGMELPFSGDFKVRIINEKGRITNLSLRALSDCWEAIFIPEEKGTYQILASNDVLPVVDRSKTGGKNVRPIDYLCAVYRVESSSSILKPVQFLDIVTYTKGDLTVVKAFKNGKEAAGIKLRIFNPDNWEKELTTNENGEAIFAASRKGLYIIRQDWIDPTPGQYKGISYTGIRHRCNYCLYVQ